MFDEPELLRTALEANPVGLYVVDRDYKIMIWSEGAEHITGYLRQEVIGHCCRENFLEHCDAVGHITCESACPLTCAIQNGRASTRVLFLRHKHGHSVPVRVYATALRNSRGSVVAALQVFHEQSVVRRPPCGPLMAVNEVPPDKPGVADRRLTLAMLHECLRQSHAQGTGCAVICMQIARIQAFKAAHTAVAANQIIESIGRSLRQVLRLNDQVGLWGDERLLVMLPGYHPASLESVSRRLAATAHRLHIRWWGDELSAPVWLGAVMSRDGEEAEAVAARAVAVAEKCALQNDSGDVVLIED